MRGDYLFNKYDIYSVIEHQKQHVAKAIQSIQPNYLLNASEEDLVKSLIDEFRLDVPVIKDAEIHVADHGEAQVDVSQDPFRGITDRSQPFYIQGTKIVIAVPFEGDAELFQVRPNTYSTTLPFGKVVGSEIHLEYTTVGEDHKSIETEYKRAVAEIKQYLGWTREFATNQFNNHLEALVREHISKRKAKLLTGAGMVASLGLPIKKREGAPTTYAVPVTRRRPKIERPKATTAPFQPEPILALEEYENILSIMKNMVTVMELSPRAFQEAGEEDIRTHFLVQLNAQYQGQATAETFNYQGKTDILLRAEGRNVFIAECKIWKGEKVLLGTIDQLLSYLSWRDTKTAILIFNRNTNFSNVLEKIDPTVKAHPCFKRELAQIDETTFRYIFHQPNDPNRELHMTVMVFDIPQPAK